MNALPSSMPDALRERYIELLGIGARSPSPTALEELIRAHLDRIPFENISKLHYLKTRELRGIPSLELFLEGIEQYGFGGTCYALNYHFSRLLASLGYRVSLHGADMSSPDAHLVLFVRLGREEYLVDAGYAAPFLSPLSRGLKSDFAIERGMDRYVLKKRGRDGSSRMELYRNGTLTHTYRAKPEPRRIEEFERSIADSYGEDATFMHAILLARHSSDRSLVIHNHTRIESRESDIAVKTLAGADALVRAVEQDFGIPAGITREALGSAGSLRNVWD